jgi:hypothetical protein
MAVESPVYRSVHFVWMVGPAVHCLCVASVSMAVCDVLLMQLGASSIPVSLSTGSAIAVLETHVRMCVYS